MQQEGQKQILFLRFRVDNAHPNKDVAVWINGIRNKLSAKDHVYYNENKIFTYAVPLKDGEDNISVTFGKGKYRLSQVQAYLGSLPERSETLYQSDVQVDKKQEEIFEALRRKDILVKIYINSQDIPNGFRISVTTKDVDDVLISVFREALA